MSTVLPIRLALVRNEVFERMREEILSCVLRPGSQVQERELVARYGVSKSPIRDALLRLEEQGLIDVLPRKGYRVKPISIREVRELYEMRLILERACVLRLVERGSDADLRTLDAYKTVPADLGLASWISYNRQFHTALADLCGNLRLARLARETIAQFDRLTYMNMSNERREVGSLQRFVDDHARIVDAIQRRERRQASALIKEHVGTSQSLLMGQIGNLEFVS